MSDRDPYDLLASLFLGDAPATPQDAGAPARTRSLGEVGAGSAARSSSLSLAEEIERRPAAPVAAGARDDHAANGRAERSAGAERAERAERTALLRVTGAVIGHLPVMAGLWATQLADRIGCSDGPTGLIRCERELVHVEILRSGGRHIGQRHGEDLHGWLRRAARIVRRWVVCIPGGAEPECALDSGFSDLVLMTSADEAAVAAAHAVIQSIDGAAQSLRLPCSLGVVIVGAPPERVQWMADELGSRAPRGIDLPLRGAIQRMDRVESGERYGFESASAPRIAEILRVLESAASDAVDRMNGEGVDGGRRAPLRSNGAAAARERALEFEPTEAAPAATGSAALAATSSAAPPVSPKAPDRAPPSPAPAAAPKSFAALIPGLRASDLRCPMAPGIELATDSAGRLHLVAPRESEPSLRAARRWADLHAEILRRALAIPGADPLPIVERVTTLDATEVESLHGCGVALDLFVESRVGASASWHHLPLNAAAKL